MSLSLPRYALEITTDGLTGVVLDILINKFADFIGSYFKKSKIVTLTVQLMLIILILYLMKVESNHLYASWQGNQSYGIVFIAVFLASQKNLTSFIKYLYDE